MALNRMNAAKGEQSHTHIHFRIHPIPLTLAL